MKQNARRHVVRKTFKYSKDSFENTFSSAIMCKRDYYYKLNIKLYICSRK